VKSGRAAAQGYSRQGQPLAGLRHERNTLAKDSKPDSAIGHERSDIVVPMTAQHCGVPHELIGGCLHSLGRESIIRAVFQDRGKQVAAFLR